MMDPLGATLAVLLLMGLWVMIKAQARDDFDWADLLRDSAGKGSVARLGALVAVIITSWAVVAVVLRTAWTPSEALIVVVGYALIWSGTKVAERAIDLALAWLARKGG
jgi:hypothetical protein